MRLAHRTRRRWAAVPEQRPRSYPAFSCLERAREILAVKTGPIETLHQPIDPMAGALRITVIVAPPDLRTFVAEIQGRGLHRGVRQRRLGPCSQATETLGNRAVARGMRRCPHPLLSLRKDLTQGLCRPVTDLEKGMEKTQEDRAVRAQGLPGALRGLPASVCTVCGASAFSKVCAAWAKTPYACCKSGCAADFETDAPRIQARPAVVALETRGPCNQLCVSSATRSLGKCSAVCTVVPTRLQRPQPCGNRSQYIASRPKTEAIAQHGTGNRLKNTAFSASSTRPLLYGLTKAGATMKTACGSWRRRRRQRNCCVHEGSVTP